MGGCFRVKVGVGLVLGFKGREIKEREMKEKEEGFVLVQWREREHGEKKKRKMKGMFNGEEEGVSGEHMHAWEGRTRERETVSLGLCGREGGGVVGGRREGEWRAHACIGWGRKRRRNVSGTV